MSDEFTFQYGATITMQLERLSEEDLQFTFQYGATITKTCEL